MIDEYQDSNDKLDYVFRLLSRNGYDEETGSLTFGDNVFLVGDVKQCIYQFRNANPANFRKASEKASLFSNESNDPLQLIRLSMNFRSSGQTVAFVNFLFANIMSLRCGEVDYTEDEWLYAGASDYEKVPLPEQAVTVAVLPEKEDDEEQQEYSQSAIYTGETIKSMLAEGYPVLLRSGVQRPCEPEDFCILTRKKKQAREYSDALTALHIPVKGVEEAGYLRSKEISLLLNLLRVLDNPLLETPLAAVMVSPMFSFTADELAEVRLTDRKLSLYSAMCLLLEEKKCGQALYEKCRSLYETLADLRQSSVLYSLEELIRRIYETTDFLSVMQLYQDGDRKRANLQLLLQYARSYEENASETGGVTGFLRYIDTMIEKGKDFAQADAEG
ncbi:MAG: UvrD-helicase domain-containing protein, partial [Oscillospiraceae bacterium]|nr:UvrD-helicase domain-containing protein [Oscillospiraceae bacterium]